MTLRRTTTCADVVRISEVIALPELARAGPRTLAGADGLERPIRWVHVAETEDVADLLLGGELILTTGISMRAGAAAAARWIRGLAREDVAGVIVELGPHLPRVPAAAVRAAAQAGLPLVTLDRPVRFVAVTEEIHGRIVNRQLAALRRAEAMERRLTGLLQAGEGVHAVVEVAAAHVGAPVALVLADGSALHTAGGAPPAAPAGGAPGAVAVAADGPLEGARLVRVPASRRLDLAERAMLERAAGLIAIVAARAHQERVLGLRERGALLAGLMDGAVAPDVAARRAAELGMRPPWRLVPFAARIARRDGDPPDAALEAWAALEQRVRPVLAHAGGGMVGTRSAQGDLLGVVSRRGEASREALMQQVAEALREGDATAAPAVTVAAGAAVGGLGRGGRGPRRRRGRARRSRRPRRDGSTRRARASRASSPAWRPTRACAPSPAAAWAPSTPTPPARGPCATPPAPSAPPAGGAPTRPAPWASRASPSTAASPPSRTPSAWTSPTRPPSPSCTSRSWRATRAPPPSPTPLPARARADASRRSAARSTGAPTR